MLAFVSESVNAKAEVAVAPSAMHTAALMIWFMSTSPRDSVGYQRDCAIGSGY
jgi:hypothetical protein